MESKDTIADLKVVARPRTFDGQQHHFREWKFAFENYMLLLDSEFLQEMVASEAATLEVAVPADKPETQKRSITLFAVLASMTAGRASRLVQTVRTRNGFEVWRLLNNEFAPKVNTRKLGMLSAIMSPQFNEQQPAYVC